MISSIAAPQLLYRARAHRVIENSSGAGPGDGFACCVNCAWSKSVWGYNVIHVLSTISDIGIWEWVLLLTIPSALVWSMHLQSLLEVSILEELFGERYRKSWWSRSHREFGTCSKRDVWLLSAGLTAILLLSYVLFIRESFFDPTM